jgi:hypothetical protein
VIGRLWTLTAALARDDDARPRVQPSTVSTLSICKPHLRTSILITKHHIAIILREHENATPRHDRNVMISVQRERQLLHILLCTRQSASPTPCNTPIGSGLPSKQPTTQNPPTTLKENSQNGAKKITCLRPLRIATPGPPPTQRHARLACSGGGHTGPTALPH